jgi:hypothetical protein
MNMAEGRYSLPVHETERELTFMLAARAAQSSGDKGGG